MTLVALFAFGFTTDPKEVPSPLVNLPAPDFTVQDLKTGETITLSGLAGNVVVLNFWASWCVACREEALVLESAHQHYQSNKAPVRFVGIAVQDTPEKALSFADTFGKTYQLALDNAAGDIGLDYGLYGVPETFFIDARGIIRRKYIGALSPDVLGEVVDGLLVSMSTTTP